MLLLEQCILYLTTVIYIYINWLCAFYFSLYVSFDRWKIFHKTFYFIDTIHSLMEKNKLA